MDNVDDRIFCTCDTDAPPISRIKLENAGNHERDFEVFEVKACKE